MDTLNTIRTNAASVATWEIDWSPHAGPFWLASMVVGTIIVFAFAAWDAERN